MDTFEFSKTVDVLQHIYKHTQINDNDDFWYTIDHLNTNLLLNHTEHLLQLRDSYGISLLLGKDYVKTCGILHDMKHKLYPITTKQKRFCAIKVIEFWDELSINYEL